MTRGETFGEARDKLERKLLRMTIEGHWIVRAYALWQLVQLERSKRRMEIAQHDFLCEFGTAHKAAKRKK